MAHRIRTARSTDIPALTQIYNQAITARFQTADLSPVDETERARWLEKHPPDQYPVFVAEDDSSNTLAYCSITPYREGREALQNTAEISYYVHTDNQGQGIGSDLIQHAISECPALGIKNLFAILLDANTNSIGLLKKFGFEQWGHLPAVANIDGQEVGHLYYGRRV